MDSHAGSETPNSTRSLSLKNLKARAVSRYKSMEISKIKVTRDREEDASDKQPTHGGGME